VKLVISDAHEGLKVAITRILCATWRRCRVGPFEIADDQAVRVAGERRHCQIDISIAFALVD